MAAADAEYAIKSYIVYVTSGLSVTLHIEIRIAEGRSHQLGETMQKQKSQEALRNPIDILIDIKSTELTCELRYLISILS
jgi:hypothetical protein